MSILLEYCTDLEPITEAFYGKPKEFIEIEKNLTKIIEMIRFTKEDPNKAVDINLMPEVAKIERLFTKVFKNKETSISFYSPVPFVGMAYNAYTIPSGFAYFKKDPNNKKRVRSEDLYINVNIDIGLIYGIDATEQEVMALILHEIGHCYDASLFSLLSKIAIAFNINGVPNIPASILSTIINLLIREPISRIHQFVNRLTTKNPVLSKFFSDFMMGYRSVVSMLNRISIFNILGNINITNYLTNLLSPSNIFGYAGEKFADSFATSYGYGKELSSALNKIDKEQGLFLSDAASEIPVLNIGNDLLRVTSKVAFFLMDPHPENVVRIKSQLDKLKRDIKDPNLKTSVRKELELEIKEMEDFINNVVMESEDEDNKNNPISYMYNMTLIKLFDGKLDPREWVEAVFNHEL